ncbi:lipoprotein receptor-related protein [Mactra antiquata]
MNFEGLVPWLLLLGCVLFVKVESKAATECDSGQWTCTISNKCIPLNWRCDLDLDCGEGDRSDEENCPAKTCADGEYSCPDGGECIALSWKCDGESDCGPGAQDEDPGMCSAMNLCADDEFACPDRTCINNKWVCDGVTDCPGGTDEKNCSKTCGADMHTCSDGQCISNAWVCDGDHDCLDKSDENGCEEKTCDSDQFKCDDSSRCINIKWKCDGDFDCPDHSDETHACPTTGEPEVCSPKVDFQCKTSRECIHKSWYCDGDPDCTDLSDEGPDCIYTCRDDQFKCANHACVSNILVCDGNEDCIDGSDEANCTRSCEAVGEFDCKGDGSMCIPIHKLCDGRNDCLHSEDEDGDYCRKKDPCYSHTCPEHSHCEKTPVPANKSMVAKCVCERGFEWVDEAGHCKDIDECKEIDTCSQICINTRGGYLCECQPGYTIEKHYFCRADGAPSWLYYANRRDIRRLRVDARFSEILVEDTDNSIALDFDYDDGLMFWTDVGLEKIISAKVDGDAVLVSDKKTIVSNGNNDVSFSPDGLAVDWLYKHIYWTDTGSNTIKVANYDGSNVKTLIDTDLDEPRAICADPENGYIYWTDWGQNPKIERAGMDGQNRETIVAGGEHLQWPNGLTIDYVGKRIYWIDSKLHKIGTANLDGSNKGHVLVDATEIRRPFSITVFEDSLYWTDWHTNSIKSVHKVTGRDRKTLSIGSYAVMDIKVYHELRQEKKFKQEAIKLCSIAQCEFLCLPAAKLSSNATVSCVCGDGQTLNSDKKTCITIAPVTTAKPAETTAKPAVTTERPNANVTANPEKPTEPSGSDKPVVTTEKPKDITTDKPFVTTNTPGGENRTVDKPDEQSGQTVGSIAIIACGVAAIIIIAVFAIGCIIFRRYKSRNKKSMNFDNPVYRKTTTSDDQCVIRNEPHLEPLTGGDETV